MKRLATFVICYTRRCLVSRIICHLLPADSTGYLEVPGAMSLVIIMEVSANGTVAAAITGNMQDIHICLSQSEVWAYAAHLVTSVPNSWRLHASSNGLMHAAHVASGSCKSRTCTYDKCQVNEKHDFRMCRLTFELLP